VNPSVKRQGGFILAEAIILVLVGVVLVAALALTASESRRQASLGDNLANLKLFAAATGAYAADSNDRLWSFSWRGGVVNHPDFPLAPTDLDAAAQQAWHILRTRSGRPDWFGLIPPPNWVPHILYSPLVILDYLDADLPARAAAAPEDHTRLLWQSDPFEGFLALPSTLRPGGNDATARRWPFSCSYTLVPAAYSPDGGSEALTQQQNGAHNLWIVPPQPTLGGRAVADIAFPAQKVLLHEEFQRHFGPRVIWFGHRDARVPLLLADGSACVRATADANLGFQPTSPQNPGPLRIRYEPQAWEPPALSDDNQDRLLITHYRFTRSGLRGRDFGGPEVPWTP
jgi:hypothetical protein